MELPCRNCISLPICISRYNDEELWDPNDILDSLTKNCKELRYYLPHEPAEFDGMIDMSHDSDISHIEFYERLEIVFDFFDDPYSEYDFLRV